MTRQVIFDTETTGLDPLAGDRITELGCVEIRDLLPTGRTFRKLINPERDIPPEVQKVTGHTWEMLRGEPVFADVAEEFLAFIGEDELVAHNAGFDMGFINMELQRIGRPEIAPARFIDTAAMAREKYPGAPASLDALCKRFDISLESRDLHGALIDSYLLAEVYLQLNGGRERRLEFSQAETTAGRVVFPKRPPRPAPLASRMTEAEREAHDAFIKALPGGTLWPEAERT